MSISVVLFGVIICHKLLRTSFQQQVIAETDTFNPRG